MIAILITLLLTAPPADSQKAAREGFKEAAGNVRAKKVTLVTSPTQDQVTVPWETGKPTNPATVKCLRLNVRASRPCLGLFGMTSRIEGTVKIPRHNGPGVPTDVRRGWEYVRVMVCGESGSASPIVELPSCMDVIVGTEVEEPFVNGVTPQLTAKRADVDDESPCACRPRSDHQGACEWAGRGATPTWQAAPYAFTMFPGYWRGACVRKTCEDRAGTSSMRGTGCE